MRARKGDADLVPPRERKRNGETEEKMPARLGNFLLHYPQFVASRRWVDKCPADVREHGESSKFPVASERRKESMFPSGQLVRLPARATKPRDLCRSAARFSRPRRSGFRENRAKIPANELANAR